jgi:amine acid ABC transporter, permease protein, 3-TM region, His/Glu/Gln/Arg/opine family
MTLDFAKTADLLIPSLMHGFGVVIQATIFGFMLAVVLAMAIAIGRLSGVKIIQGGLYLFLELIRGTPLLVQLVYIYYVVPLLMDLAAGVFGFKTNVQIASLTAGIWGLGINYGCYMSEVIRASILSIDNGQTEAAYALGFGKYEALFRIVIPQALRNIIPSLGNYLVMMVKDTSLLAYVTVNELLLRTQTFASQTFLTIESYSFLALAYLIISIPLSHLAKLIEARTK